MKYLVLVGRILYSGLFILAAFGHFSEPAIMYAKSQGVPLASFFVPLAGVLSFVGGLSILLGYKAKYGACLLVLFLVPCTFFMHKFWTVTDPFYASIQTAMFLKNLALVGAALLIVYFGSGPLSLEKTKKKGR